ncbi:MAG: M20/M25/M40 family metallo-hydrolase, partial [Candidatus Zixiibacteriota bacterium]
RLALAGKPTNIYPLADRHIEISYTVSSPVAQPDLSASTLQDIQQLIDQVNQDSLYSYVLALESYSVRLTGTEENYAARDWIAAKFEEFGYDAVDIDPFIGAQCWTYIPVPGYNVIARKTGTVYPDRFIIIGGHFDAVPDCPGSNDNASGTAAVLEMARILKDVPTPMSIVFFAIDSEESGLHGAYHYVDEALEANEDIVLMINLDMIAHLPNFDGANVYFGADWVYSLLWRELANLYCGIAVTDVLSGAASDQRAFWEAGFDAIFVQEDYFSTLWHTPYDSIAYMNFDYMTRMVQATLATAVTISEHPPPIRITSILEPGDGHSQILTWEPNDPVAIDHYTVAYFPVGSPGSTVTVDVPSTESSYTVDGLVEGQEYAYYVQAYDAQGRTAFKYIYAHSTPSSVPVAPPGALALPLPNAVSLSWIDVNVELDFDHYDIIRDGEVVGQTPDTFYIDSDPALGSELHYYYITAVDLDDICSDTVGIAPAWSKAATLDPDRILAVNRTSCQIIDFVSGYQTGVFLQEALEGYNHDYYCDTLATKYPHELPQLDLVEMVDYGVMVVAAEAGKYDDIGDNPQLRRGILDTLAYYLSIGGKLVVFGRWGDVGVRDTIDYAHNWACYDNAYHDWFHIAHRVQTETDWPFLSTVVTCDLVGAHSKDRHYPHLFWDSLMTLEHANSQAGAVTDVAGIPCASFVGLTSDVPEVIYSYDCRKKTKSQKTEGQPVAWRYLGPDYSYVYFDIPLSFFEREPAIAALRQAVDDLMGGPESAEDLSKGGNTPNSFALSQNYPNPFNPMTDICYSLPAAAHVRLSVYNILGQMVTTLVDERKTAGTHTVRWDGTDEAGRMVATGIYLYQLRADDYIESRKMLLLK